MKTKTTKTTKTTKIVTIVTRTADQIGADIVIALQGIGKAKETASEFYKEAASALDAISQTWTEIDFTKEAKAAFTAAGVTDAQGEKIKGFRTNLLAVVKEYNESETKTVWQYIKRWSAGYTGSKPNHPDAKERIEKNPPAKAIKADKDKDKPDTTTPVRDLVHADPQKARIVLGELVAGFTTLKGACKKNKLSTQLLQEVLDLLAETDAAIAALK